MNLFTIGIGVLGVVLLIWMVLAIILNARINYRIVRDTDTGMYLIQKENDVGWEDFNATATIGQTAPLYHEYDDAECDLRRFLAKEKGEKFEIMATAYTNLAGTTFRRYL